jgi:hypothetical protein
MLYPKKLGLVGTPDPSYLDLEGDVRSKELRFGSARPQELGYGTAEP